MENREYVPMVLAYVWRGVEENIVDSIQSGGDVILIGPYGAGKSSTALASLALLQRRGIPGVLIRIWSEDEIHVGLERVLLPDENGMIFVPVVHVPRSVFDSGRLVEGVVAALSQLSRRARGKERGPGRLRGLSKHFRLALDIFSDYSDIIVSVDLPSTDSLEALSQVAPGVQLALQAAVKVREWLVRRRASRYKGRIVIGVDDLSHLYGLGEGWARVAVAHLTSELNASALLVFGVGLDAFFKLRSDYTSLREWLEEKGLRPGNAVFLDYPDWPVFYSIMREALGPDFYKVGRESLHTIALATGMNPALALVLAREAAWDPDKARRLLETIASVAGGPREAAASRLYWWHGREAPEEGLAYMYSTATMLYRYLRQEDPVVTALVAANTYPLTDHEIAVFEVLSIGWDPEEVVDKDEELASLLSGAEEYAGREGLQLGWLAMIIAGEQGTTPRAVRNTMLFRLKPGPYASSIGRDLLGRERYKLTPTLASLALILNEAAKHDESLLEELRRARETLLLTLAYEARTRIVATASQALLGLYLVESLWDEISEGKYEAPAKIVLAMALSSFPALIPLYKHQALQLIDGPPGEALLERALLAAALARGRATSLFVFSPSELAHLRSIAEETIEEATRRRDPLLLAISLDTLLSLIPASLDPALQASMAERIFDAMDYFAEWGLWLLYVYFSNALAMSLSELGLVEEATILINNSKEIINKYNLLGNEDALTESAKILRVSPALLARILESVIAKTEATIHVFTGNFKEAYKALEKIACNDILGEHTQLLTLCLRFLGGDDNVLGEETGLEGCTLPPLKQAHELVTLKIDDELWIPKPFFDSTLVYAIQAISCAAEQLEKAKNKGGSAPDFTWCLAAPKAGIPSPGTICFLLAMKRTLEGSIPDKYETVLCLLDILEPVARNEYLQQRAREALEKLAPGSSTYIDEVIKIYNYIINYLEHDDNSEDSSIWEILERGYLIKGFEILDKIKNVESLKEEIPGLKQLINYKEVDYILNEKLILIMPAVMIALATQHILSALLAILGVYTTTGTKLTINTIEEVNKHIEHKMIEKILDILKKAVENKENPAQTATDLLRVWCSIIL